MERRDTHLSITGMSCDACVRHVSGALRAVPGVVAVNVTLRGGLAEVQHDGASVEALIGAVREAGYAARPRE